MKYFMREMLLDILYPRKDIKLLSIIGSQEPKAMRDTNNKVFVKLRLCKALFW